MAWYKVEKLSQKEAEVCEEISRLQVSPWVDSSTNYSSTALGAIAPWACFTIVLFFDKRVEVIFQAFPKPFLVFFAALAIPFGLAGYVIGKHMCRTTQEKLGTLMKTNPVATSNMKNGTYRFINRD